MRFLFPYMARWRSANFTRYHQLLGELARQGHEVFVLEPPPRVSRETNFTEYKVPVPAGLTIQEVPVPGMIWRRPVPLDKLVKKGLVTLVSHRSVNRLIREARIDVLLLYNIPQALMIDAPCTVVFDIADDLVTMLDFELGSLARYGPGALARRLYRRMLDRADLITTSSAGLREEIGPHAVLLPNGVDRDEIARADGSAIRADLTGPVVGFLGAFEYFVDFDLVLKAAARLPDVTFLLVGGGRDWERVRDRVKTMRLRNVVLPGPVPHSLGLDSIAAMDVALIPFTRDRVSDFACPLKLFEYMALGKPVISTPGYEIERIAGPFVTFIKDAKSLTEAIRHRLLSDAATRARVYAARRLVEEHYTWDRIAQNFLAAVADRVAATRPQPHS